MSVPEGVIMGSADFRREIDAWIKGFRRELNAHSSEMDDFGDMIRAHNEEIRFNYENIVRLETKLDRIETLLEDVYGALSREQAREVGPVIQKLRAMG
ncbi:MAG: hypothetical protein ABH879_10960 [archaeon]